MGHTSHDSSMFKSVWTSLICLYLWLATMYYYSCISKDFVVYFSNTYKLCTFYNWGHVLSLLLFNLEFSPISYQRYPFSWILFSDFCWFYTQLIFGKKVACFMLVFNTFMTIHSLYLLLYICTKYRASIIGRNEVEVDCGIDILDTISVQSLFHQIFYVCFLKKSTSATTNIIIDGVSNTLVGFYRLQSTKSIWYGRACVSINFLFVG